jgi:hypothetical protein
MTRTEFDNLKAADKVRKTGSKVVREMRMCNGRLRAFNIKAGRENDSYRVDADTFDTFEFLPAYNLAVACEKSVA